MDSFDKYCLFSQLPNVQKLVHILQNTARGRFHNCFFMEEKIQTLIRSWIISQALRSDNIWSLNWPAAVLYCTCVAMNIDPCKLKTPELSDTTSLIGSSGIIPSQYSSRRPRLFSIFSSASSRKNVGTTQGLEKLVKMCPHLHLRIWCCHPGSQQNLVGGKN